MRWVTLEKSFRIVLFVLYFVCCPAESLFANELKLEPALSLAGGYNDNLFWEKNGKVGDAVVKIHPDLKLDYRSEVSHISSLFSFDFFGYADEKELNDIKSAYQLAGDFQGSEKWSSEIESSFIKDTTLDSYLEETGRVIRREDHDLYKIGGTVAYAMFIRSSIACSYNYLNSSYSDPDFFDYNQHSVFLSYRHRMTNEIDTLSIDPAYSYTKTGWNNTENLSLSMGWTRKLTEVFYARMMIGLRHTVVSYDNSSEDDDYQGAKALFDLTWNRAERIRIKINYFHDLRTTVDGDVINTDNVYLKYDHSLTYYWGVGISGRLINSYQLTSSVADKSRTIYYQIEPHVYYHLTETSSLIFYYRYQNSYDDSLKNNKEVECNSVWLEFQIGFPVEL
ncbi:MAG: hypothetical protein KJ737_22265 [Proteobacteria bacterium]|nr:hypothetical protein [Pseudomonadota bacterium]